VFLAGLVGLVLLARPDTTTLLVVFLLYTNAVVVAVKFHGVPFILGAAVPLLLLWPLFWQIAVRREKLIVAPTLWPVALFVAMQLLSILAANRPDVAVAKMKVAATECLLLYVLITNAIRHWTTLRQVVWVLVAAAALMGALGAYQQATGTQHRDYGGFAQVPGIAPAEVLMEGKAARFAGPVGEKNYFAQFMLMALPLAGIGLASACSLRRRVLAVLACVFIGLGIALTASRGAAVGFLVMLIVMTGMRYIKVRHAIAGLVGLVLVASAFPQYAARLQSLGRVAHVLSQGKQIQHADKATQGRLTEMAAACLVFVEHPVLGVGPGMFRYHFLEKADALGFQVHGTTRMAHCALLEIAAEHGVLGLGSFLAILLVTLWRLAKIRTTDTRPEVVNMATAFILVVVVLITTGVFLSFAYVRYYWLMLALAASVEIVARMPSNGPGVGEGSESTIERATT
jgi:O-antigen ligase